MRDAKTWVSERVLVWALTLGISVNLTGQKQISVLKMRQTFTVGTCVRRILCYILLYILLY